MRGENLPQCPCLESECARAALDFSSAPAGVYSATPVTSNTGRTVEMLLHIRVVAMLRSRPSAPVCELLNQTYSSLLSELETLKKEKTPGFRLRRSLSISSSSRESLNSSEGASPDGVTLKLTL